MKNKKILFLILLICILSPNVFAAEMCKMQTGGALDNILNSFYAPTSQWRSSLFKVALKLYWMWVVLEMGYQIAIKKVLSGDHQKLWYFVLVRMFTATAFAQIFVNPQFYDWIIEFFLKHGSEAGGIAITPQSGNPFGDFSPSGVLSIGDCMWRSVQNAITDAKFGITDILPVMTVAFPAILIAAAIYAMLGIIALTLFITALEAYVVLNAGVILLGFAGSSWTMGFWNKYLSYVGGIAIRLFVMCLILGMMNTEITKALNVMNSMMGVSDVATFTAFYGAVVGLLIKMVIFAFLILKIPAMAGSMLTGTVNSGLGDVVAGASMMLAGAGIAAGLAKMGVNMGGGGSGGGDAKEALKNTLRGDGSSGTPKSSSGGSSSGGQTTPSQQAKQAGSENKRNEAIGEKVRGGANNDSNNANSQSNNSSDKSGSSDNGFANHMNDKLNSGSALPNSNGSGSDTGSSSSNSGSTPASGGSGGTTPAWSGSSESPSSTSGNSNDGGSGAGISSSAGGSSSENVGSTSDAGGSPSSPSSGSIGGNSNASGASKSINATDAKKSKAIKDSLNRNIDKLGKNFNKVNQDHHAGGAEVNASGLHKE